MEWENEPIEEYQFFKEKFPEAEEKLSDFLDTVSGDIDSKTREFIISAILASKGFEEGFKFHIRESMNQGGTKEEIARLALLLMPYAGVKDSLRALKWCREEGIFED